MLKISRQQDNDLKRPPFFRLLPRKDDITVNLVKMEYSQQRIIDVSATVKLKI